MPLTFAQRELFPSPQDDLFGEDAPIAVAPTYQVKREHVLNRLVEMLDDLKSAARWPWSETRVSLNRETVCPYLLRLLPDDEAEQWRIDLARETERLDCAEKESAQSS